MAYSGRTSYYQIPIAITDDVLDEEENIQQMQMIDDLLEAATGVVGTGVIQEGVYQIVSDTGTGYKVLLNPVSGIAFSGILNSGLAQTASQIAWESLSAGNFYYLYLQFTKDIYKNSTAFNVLSRTDPVDANNFNYLFLATLDLTGMSPILEVDPEGKVYANQFGTHIGTQFNPHSSTLTQTNVVLSGSISGSLDSARTILVNQEFVTSTNPLVVLNHAVSGNPIIRSMDEFVIGDLRTTTRLSASGQTSFDNSRISIVGAINENTKDILAFTPSITGNAANIATNSSNISLNSSSILTNIGNTAINAFDIEINSVSISGNTAAIAFNANNISGNTLSISGNAGDIVMNASQISTNISDIAANVLAISSISGQVDTNISNINTHGFQLYNIDSRVGNLECAVFGWCSSSSSSSL